MQCASLDKCLKYFHANTSLVEIHAYSIRTVKEHSLIYIYTLYIFYFKYYTLNFNKENSFLEYFMFNPRVNKSNFVSCLNCLPGGLAHAWWQGTWPGSTCCTYHICNTIIISTLRE